MRSTTHEAKTPAPPIKSTRPKLTAEKFLRMVNTTQELESYEAGKIRLTGTEETLWQRLMARSWMFSPERFFPEEMLILNLSKLNAQWELHTADELQRRTQRGYQNLRGKYRTI